MTNGTSEVDKTPLALADAAEGSLEILEVHVDLAGDLVQEGDQVGSILRGWEVFALPFQPGPTGTRYPTRTRSFCRYPNPTRFFFKIIGYFGYRVFQKILTFASI